MITIETTTLASTPKHVNILFIGVHLNFNDSDSAHWFQYLSIPNFDSSKVKKNKKKFKFILSVVANVFILSECHEQKSTG